MKEIGERLKETRESIGISIEEAAEDLKMRASQIEAIEAGNMDNFKDIFYLKYFIRDYSKYLGLNYEDMVDEFNEYLFDYTSKISIEDIKKAKKEEPLKEEKKIQSPYTVEHTNKIKIPSYVYLIIGIVMIIVIGYFVMNYIETNKKSDDDTLVMNVLD